MHNHLSSNPNWATTLSVLPMFECAQNCFQAWVLRDIYRKKLFLDFGQGAKLDLLVIVELGFVGSSGKWGTVLLS